jgi:hypothetical protein
LTGTGMLATMALGPPCAIAAQLAYPNQQSVAVVGDGGFTQLMGELVTAVKYQLPVKIIILKNNSLAEVLFDQKELGDATYGCVWRHLTLSLLQRPAERRASNALNPERSRQPFMRRFTLPTLQSSKHTWMSTKSRHCPQSSRYKALNLCTRRRDACRFGNEDQWGR